MMGLLFAGCGGENAVSPSSVLVTDRSTHALTSGQLLTANGTYGAGCTSRTGAWSVRIEPGATLDHAPLSVVKGNTACVLTLTGLIDDVDYTASPTIDLSDAFAVAASSFAFEADPLGFYANAQLSSITFASNFVLEIQYAYDLNALTAANSAGYAVATSVD
jgi:hypothetical protein